MCAMGINGFSSRYGTSGIYNHQGRRANFTPKQQQQQDNRANAGKAVVTLAAIIAAIKFRKPIGKAIAPAVNALKTKFPTLANTARAVKGRAGRVFNPIKERVTKWFSGKAAPTVKKVAQDTVTFTKDKAAPAVKKAAQDTVTFTKETAAPTVKKGVKAFLEKIAQKANSDLPKLG